MNAAVVIAAAMKAGEVLDRKIFASSTALRKEMEERDIDTRTPGASERFFQAAGFLTAYAATVLTQTASSIPPSILQDFAAASERACLWSGSAPTFTKRASTSMSVRSK